ncbi:VPLPA-CTERM sorting domain-containing protein [Methylomonas sp. UP202]|uniref:VPLPA-CTERM sorting domain-containing protein n=1 Tax=Methylomonas sp. UP202 TaxID=3040943 RepID=UPI00247AC5E8|nr:VPLPA-CTERM sorting domain-containing protein [Methylomonas sp. UP202]WGS86094.1 VPLPA-CTERM sorting domain-containing protein [Methylomonas sp. UP202]
MKYGKTLIAAGLLFGTNAQAAQISSAHAEFNWDNLSVYSNSQLVAKSEYTLTTPTLKPGAYSFANPYPWPASLAYTNNLEFSQSTTGLTTALASSGDTLQYAESTAQNGIAGSMTRQRENRSIVFNTSGSYQIVVPYSLSIEVSGNASPGESSYSQVGLNLSIGYEGLGQDGSLAERWSELLHFTNGSSELITTHCIFNAQCNSEQDGIHSASSTSVNGLLTFNLTGQEFIFLGGVNTSASNFINSPAAVPVPASAWLFGSVILGFAGSKRRSKLS